MTDKLLFLCIKFKKVKLLGKININNIHCQKYSSSFQEILDLRETIFIVILTVSRHDNITAYDPR